MTAVSVKSAPRLPLNGIPRSIIHELRTPLTAIRGYAQLLQRGVKDPGQAERALGTIVRESERLSAMLEQLAQVAEANLGRRASRLARFDLAGLAADQTARAAQRWPEYQFTTDCDVPLEVMADPQQLAACFSSLLDNAAVFSPEGSSIEVSARKDAEWACLAVRDHGIGIPRDELERVFGCFARASNASRAPTNVAQGLGIGLFLARTAAVEAGGELWADSEPENGSTFHLRLPLAT